jgi:hypothetical protein
MAFMSGPGQVIGFRNQFAQHAADYSFRPRTVPETHTTAPGWMAVITGRGDFATGTDVLELDDAGRITSITGFLDQATEGFDPHAGH